MSDHGQRIDVWLWHARFFKTRSLATATVSKGHIRVTANGSTRAVRKPATLIRPGDRLTMRKNGRIVALTVDAIAARRGPALEAQALYTLIDDDAETGHAG